MADTNLSGNLKLCPYLKSRNPSASKRIRIASDIGPQFPNFCRRILGLLFYMKKKQLLDRIAFLNIAQVRCQTRGKFWSLRRYYAFWLIFCRVWSHNS